MEVWLLQKGWRDSRFRFEQQDKLANLNTTNCNQVCNARIMNHDFCRKKNCSHGLSYIFPMVFPVTWTILPYLGRSPT